MTSLTLTDDRTAVETYRPTILTTGASVTTADLGNELTGAARSIHQLVLLLTNCQE